MHSGKKKGTAFLGYSRPHTTVKNARNTKSVSQEKLPYFEGIFELLTHEQQELPSLLNVHQYCIRKSSCFMRETAVKRILFFLEIFVLYEVYYTFTQGRE